MKRRRYALYGLSVIWLGLGCSSPTPVHDDGGSTGTTGGIPSDGGSAGSAARIRLANLVPLGVPIDLCTAAHGSGQFQGPVLASAGLIAGVDYADVSGYISIPAGDLDFRLVPAGGDCSQDLAGTSDLTNLPPLAAGAAFTVLEVSGASQSIQIFEDDSSAPDPETAGLRFINVSARTPSLDLGSLQDGSFIPWLTGVQFLAVGGSAQMYSLDANGYLLMPELANVLLEIESQSEDLLDFSLPPGEPFPLSGGALYTLFAVTGAPLSGLFCSDLTLLQSSYTPCVLYPLPGIANTVGTSGGTTGGTTGGTGGGSSSGTGSTTAGTTT